MRRAPLTMMLIAAAVLGAAAEKARKVVPPLPAVQYAFHETHAAEKLTVAAEPADSDATTPNTRLDYIHHGYLPVRVIISNDSDVTLDLDEARIHLITADNTVIDAATDEELQRRLFSRKSAAGTKIPMPNPIPSITIHHKPVDKQILADDEDFGFKTTSILAHTTVAGYLYYDVRQIDEPVLAHATLEVRDIEVMATKKQLFAFNIELKPSAPAPASAKP